ncbi:cell wall-binding repeat-containing protein [uncultured Clostridium sp.]|uniref:cell wall-binding repeat-containing protein n=1 Tax=uncultured Clostridium sp. TaxID=59620 RepID=UPI0028E503AA|nr:cell wall-binding repeat-containing protein [uncultured Clostridium sp.]
MKEKNSGKFNKKVVSKVVLTTIIFNMVNSASVQALGNFDIKSSFISKEINKEEVQIAPGIKEKKYSFRDKSGKKIEMFTVEVDTRNPDAGIEAGTPNDKDAYGMQTVTGQAKAATSAEEKVVAAVNGDFYYMVTGEPIGIVYKDGRAIKSKYEEGWDFFGILKDGTPIIGDKNKYEQVKNNLEEALGGSAILVNNGKANKSLSTQKDPRTAVGIKEDGTVFFLAIDGRQEPYSAGISLADLADIMVSMGAVQALNLDGGGSTTYISRKPGTNDLSLGNKPSEGKERVAGNSWLIVSKVESNGEFHSTHIEPFDKSFTPESAVEFKAKGMDRSGAPSPLPSSGLSWSLSDDSFGYIDERGIFTSTGKTGQVEVLSNYYGEVVGKTTVEIALPDKIDVNIKQIAAEKNSQVQLNVYGEYKERKLNIKNEDIIWEVPEDIGTIDSNGILHTVDKTATGKIIGKFKGTNLSVSIDVVVGKPSQALYDFEKGIGNWKVTTAGRGEKGSVEKAISGKDPIKNGSGSLKVNFDFTSGEKNATLGVYAGTGENQNISGKPKAIGMWIYGTPESKGYWLRMSLVDGNGQTQYINLTSESGVNWTGWKYIKAEIPESIKTPFRISETQGIRIMSIASGTKGPMTKGAIYIDDIKAIYSDEDTVDEGTNQGEGSALNKIRIAGENRFQTATSIAKMMYDKGTSNIVIANAFNYTDQISASILANSLNAPVLLIGNNPNNDKEALEYIKAHMNKAGKVHIVGGKAAVNDSMVNSIKALGINNIDRMEGKDRYETNIKTNAKLNTPEGTPIIIASGEGFADALSVASIAQINKYPMILTGSKSLSKDAEEYIKKIKPTKVYIVGGEGVVSQNVKNSVSKLTALKDKDIIRISGGDRYKTNMNVLKHFNIKGDTIAIASGVTFPDSLVGSVYATYKSAPIMLVNNNMNISEQKDFISSKDYKDMIIFGGNGVVKEDLF